MRYADPLRMFLLLGVLVFFAPDTWTLEDYTLPEAWTAPVEEGTSFQERYRIGVERLRGFGVVEEQQRKYFLDQALAQSIMFVLQSYWLLVGYQVRYGGKGLRLRLLPLLYAVVAFIAFTFPYGQILQLTMVQMLMPPVA
jgi:hypothetical protein